MCEVRSRKNGQEPKKKEKKSTVVSSKKKSTVMSPIWRRMKKRNPSDGQNGQLVHWWLLIHSGPWPLAPPPPPPPTQSVCSVPIFNNYNSVTNMWMQPHNTERFGEIISSTWFILKPICIPFIFHSIQFNSWIWTEFNSSCMQFHSLISIE